MLLGYNTNGMAHHRLVDAIHLLADVGYKSVAITLDAGALDPYDDKPTLTRQIKAVRRALDDRGLARVVETGARFLLNPHKKHDPTLMDPDPYNRRLDFLWRSLRIAKALDSKVVSLWSGAAPDPDVGEQILFDRLIKGLKYVLNWAEARELVIGFEPEPGMFIDTMARFAELDDRLGHPALQLTLDVGHLHCLEDEPVANHIERWGPRIVNVHIEDMVRGVHEHLPFGTGTMDFPPILAALNRVGYGGGLHVELSRHSAEAASAVIRARDFLTEIWPVSDKS